MSRLTRDGTAEAVSRDQILRHVRGQGNVNFPRSADDEQDWQPYLADPCSSITCDDHIIHTTYIHTKELIIIKLLIISYYVHTNIHTRYRRYFQHAHFIPIAGVGKRGEY